MASSTATNRTDRSVPLRRAAYVNVNQLVRSQYEIDLQILEKELAKLNATNTSPQDENVDGWGDTSKGALNEGIGLTTPVKPPNAWASKKLSVLPGGPSKTPLPGKSHQSRLQPPRDGFNLCLLVGKVELVVDKYRVDGSRVLIAEVDVGDETGVISLRARDEQIDLLRKVSSDRGAIVLRNCTMELYQGKHLRLGVSKWGKISVYPDGIESTPDPPLSFNPNLNFSLVDLNIVAQAKLPDETPIFPVSVATVHHKHKKQNQHHHHTQKGFEDSSRVPTNRAGRPVGHFIHQKHKQESYHRQYQHHQQPHQQSRRPRSNSHLSAGSQYFVPASPQSSFQSPQMYQQQYSDTGSVYSYQSQQSPHQGTPGSPVHQFLPEDHYKRQQQMVYQYGGLQQRHAEQMQYLQQQHETQRRILEQQQAQAVAAHSALIPGDLNRAESHDSTGEYSIPQTPVPTMVVPVGQSSSPPPSMLQHPSSPDYYGIMGNFQGGEGGQQARGITPPPMSPPSGPQAGPPHHPPQD